jgi:hypothetical protein
VPEKDLGGLERCRGRSIKLGLGAWRGGDGGHMLMAEGVETHGGIIQWSRRCSTLIDKVGALSMAGW